MKLKMPAAVCCVASSALAQALTLLVEDRNGRVRAMGCRNRPAPALRLLDARLCAPTASR